MQDHQQDFLEVLEGAVRRESPTEGDPNDLIACRDYFAGLFREIGFHVTTVKSLDPRFADHLLVEYGAGAGRAAEELAQWLKTRGRFPLPQRSLLNGLRHVDGFLCRSEIGRASCRERV